MSETFGLKPETKAALEAALEAKAELASIDVTEVKGIRHVRDVAYWKLPYGTPIVGRGKGGTALTHLRVTKTDYPGWDMVTDNSGKQKFYVGQYAGEDFVTVTDMNDKEVTRGADIDEALSKLNRKLGGSKSPNPKQVSDAVDRHQRRREALDKVNARPVPASDSDTRESDYGPVKVGDRVIIDGGGRAGSAGNRADGQTGKVSSATPKYVVVDTDDGGQFKVPRQMVRKNNSGNQKPQEPKAKPKPLSKMTEAELRAERDKFSDPVRRSHEQRRNEIDEELAKRGATKNPTEYDRDKTRLTAAANLHVGDVIVSDLGADYDLIVDSVNVTPSGKITLRLVSVHGDKYKDARITRRATERFAVAQPNASKKPVSASSGDRKPASSIAKMMIRVGDPVDPFKFTTERRDRLENEIVTWADSASVDEMNDVIKELEKWSKSGGLTARERATAKVQLDHIRAQMKARGER